MLVDNAFCVGWNIHFWQHAKLGSEVNQVELVKLLQEFLTCYKGGVCSKSSPPQVSATHPATLSGSALGGLFPPERR